MMRAPGAMPSGVCRMPATFSSRSRDRAPLSLSAPPACQRGAMVQLDEMLPCGTSQREGQP